MKVKGTLNFSSYELEELRAKAEADNKFDFFNPFEYLSLFITALCVIGFFSACAPTLYLQARVIRYTTYGLELVMTLDEVGILNVTSYGSLYHLWNLSSL